MKNWTTPSVGQIRFWFIETLTCFWNWLVDNRCFMHSARNYLFLRRRNDKVRKHLVVCGPPEGYSGQPAIAKHDRVRSLSRNERNQFFHAERLIAHNQIRRHAKVGEIQFSSNEHEVGRWWLQQRPLSAFFLEIIARWDRIFVSAAGRFLPLTNSAPNPKWRKASMRLGNIMRRSFQGKLWCHKFETVPGLRHWRFAWKPGYKRSLV